MTATFKTIDAEYWARRDAHEIASDDKRDPIVAAYEAECAPSYMQYVAECALIAEKYAAQFDAVLADKKAGYALIEAKYQSQLAGLCV